jgi:hypothetical protein
MTALEEEACPAQRFVVVVFDGASLGIMLFAFGVFDMALHYGVLPDLDVRVVSGEPATAITGGGLSCYVPYDLDAIWPGCGGWPGTGVTATTGGPPKPG